MAVLAVLIIGSAAAISLLPYVDADASSSLLSLFNSIKTIVTRVDNNLNKAIMMDVITGSLTTDNNDSLPYFWIVCNMPWKLMAIYITANNLSVPEGLRFGWGFIGGRYFNTTFFGAFEAYPANDYPIFPADLFSALGMIFRSPCLLCLLTCRLT